MAFRSRLKKTARSHGRALATLRGAAEPRELAALRAALAREKSDRETAERRLAAVTAQLADVLRLASAAGRELLAHGVAAPANETTPPTSPGAPAPRATVLVVEDEETSRTLLRKVLADAGYGAVAVGTAAEARSAADRERIDILVTDLRLPDGSGDALASELTRRREGLAVLYVSGERARATTTPGAFLEKPVDLDELLDVLGALAKGHPVTATAS